VLNQWFSPAVAPIVTLPPSQTTIAGTKRRRGKWTFNLITPSELVLTSFKMQSQSHQTLSQAQTRTQKVLKRRFSSTNYNRDLQSDSVMVSFGIRYSALADSVQFRPPRRTCNRNPSRLPQNLSRALPGTIGPILTIWPCNCNTPLRSRRTPTMYG